MVTPGKFERRLCVGFNPGDRCTVPRGSLHEVLDRSDNFELIEITSLADYETVPAETG